MRVSKKIRAIRTLHGITAEPRSITYATTLAIASVDAASLRVADTEFKS
jgi:hypothetical protein